MTIYDEFRAVADELLAVSDQTFGQLGAIRRAWTSGGSATSTAPAKETTLDYPVNVALFPVDQRDIDGSFIKSGDWRALVSTTQPVNADTWNEGYVREDIAGYQPKTTDLLICSEGALTIVDLGKFAPAGTVTHYSMVVRK